MIGNSSDLKPIEADEQHLVLKWGSWTSIKVDLFLRPSPTS